MQYRSIAVTGEDDDRAFHQFPSSALPVATLVTASSIPTGKPDIVPGSGNASGKLQPQQQQQQQQQPPPSLQSKKKGGRPARQWVSCSVCRLDVTWSYVLHSDASRAIVAHSCRCVYFFTCLYYGAFSIDIFYFACNALILMRRVGFNLLFVCTGNVGKWCAACVPPLAIPCLVMVSVKLLSSIILILFSVFGVCGSFMFFSPFFAKLLICGVLKCVKYTGVNQSYQLSDYRISLPERGLFSPQRVCLLCYFDA